MSVSPVRKRAEPVVAPKRCAIYTRVSSDAGLEQDFNSLDNQREAAEAHIRSQMFEGWQLIPAAYDDGGWSGGSIERPGLQRLLDDVRAGKVDIIVVYKVDRLTRSLADFAKLVELFDMHGVSFVSVTQSFNTTTSMGRLTLNVLLSFAQFEREVTGERIRDKIAASKKKGIWMGGNLPYGYRVESRKLLIVPDEAADIRMIFSRYLELRSVPALVAELREKGFVTRLRARPSGRQVGGVPLTNGPLAVILKNRIYIGEIVHKGECYDGEHEPIIDRELFDSVQVAMAENARGSCARWRASGAILLGRIYDDRGNRMTPAHANKRGGKSVSGGFVRYRYYVSSAIAQRRTEECGSVPRVSAYDIEQTVVDALRQAMTSGKAGGNGEQSRPGYMEDGSRAAADLSAEDLIERHLERVIVHGTRLEIVFWPDTEKDGAPETASVPWFPPVRTRRQEIHLPESESRSVVAPIRAEARTRLLAAVGRARRWVRELCEDPAATVPKIAAREKLSERTIRLTLPLAFLAPELVRAIVDGTLPSGIGITSLAELPVEWATQAATVACAPGRSDAC